MIAVVFSTLFRRQVAALLASLPVLAGLMALTMFTDGVFSRIRWFDPVTLLIYPRLAEIFIVQNVAGYPVFAHELAPVGCVMLAVLLILGSFMLYGRRDAND